MLNNFEKIAIVIMTSVICLAFITLGIFIGRFEISNWLIPITIGLLALSVVAISNMIFHLVKHKSSVSKDTFFSKRMLRAHRR